VLTGLSKWPSLLVRACAARFGAQEEQDVDDRLVTASEWIRRLCWLQTVLPAILLMSQSVPSFLRSSHPRLHRLLVSPLLDPTPTLATDLLLVAELQRLAESVMPMIWALGNAWVDAVDLPQLARNASTEDRLAQCRPRLCLQYVWLLNCALAQCSGRQPPTQPGPLASVGLGTSNSPETVGTLPAFRTINPDSAEAFAQLRWRVQSVAGALVGGSWRIQIVCVYCVLCMRERERGLLCSN
jgi:hypothetical protein